MLCEDCAKSVMDEEKRKMTMKRILAAVVLAALACGCDLSPSTEVEPAPYGFSKVEFDGHTYICSHVYMGEAICHDPGCKCLKIGD